MRYWDQRFGSFSSFGLSSSCYLKTFQYFFVFRFTDVFVIGRVLSLFNLIWTYILNICQYKRVCHSHFFPQQISNMLSLSLPYMNWASTSIEDDISLLARASHYDHVVLSEMNITILTLKGNVWVRETSETEICLLHTYRTVRTSVYAHLQSNTQRHTTYFLRINSTVKNLKTYPNKKVTKPQNIVNTPFSILRLTKDALQ